MSELNRNTAASGAQRTVTAGERMKNKYVQSLRQVRDGGNSQQKSVTEFAEDEVAEKARTSAAAVSQTANRAGNTAVRETPQSVEELKKQAQIRKAKKAAKAKRQAAQSAKETAAAVEESGSQTSAQAVSRSRQTANVRRHDTVKQAARANPNRYAKSAGQTAKTTERTVTFSARTTGAAAKTTANAAKDIYKRQQQAKQAAETSRKSIRATVEAVKAAVNGTKALVTLLMAGGWVSVVIILIVVLFGCSLSLFGGGSNSNSYTPVSAEVQAYQTLIQQYAKEHGIPEYVDLIMAVMMQESGGEGTDPMQASECAYNAKYPKTPNGITDPEYSINVGIRNLAACLKAAKVESPIDMERIKLALQGYNYGNNYIAWADTNYKGYSAANAIEFSDMMARKKGWSSYGDSNYVLHVLKYYPIGRAFTSGGNQVIVDIAATQIGNKGGKPYWSWYGFNGRVAWCACFVSWCADQCGYIDAGIIPKFSLCSDAVAWFKKNGQWQDRNYVPQAGDLIFFDWENNGRTDHVGIVEKCEDGVVYTIEGNSGDACKRQHYAVGSKKIYGYGVPLY